MVVLKLLGGASLERADGVYTGPAAQRHRIALLAILASSRSRPMPREKLMALLWPERDAEQARRLLNQSVYVLRKALGNDAILSTGDALRLDTGSVGCDMTAAGAIPMPGRPASRPITLVPPPEGQVSLQGAPRARRTGSRRSSRSSSNPSA